ncbi:MAG: hypothetical protein CVU29_04790 [Betaproteobacteria bacterium HGW-Betaproteobacteria-22]|nr:MAG: hypothetical protein CVU29_04790 [Betaproteobacteria bacterium HGW-Betaproteobacteria-22]
MTIRDEHLRQALQHAPDRLSAPHENTSRAVLSYARQTLEKEQRVWWQSCMMWLKKPLVSNWQRAGVGGLATALVVMLIFWQMAPEKATWPDAFPEHAFNTDKNNAVALMKDKNAAELNAPLMRRKARATGAPAQEQTMATQPGHVIGQGEHQSIALDHSSPATNEIASAPISAPAVVAGANDSSGAMSSANQARGSGSQKTEAASAELSEAKPVKKDAVLDIMQLLDSIKNEGGQTVAARDISLSKLRMLKLDMSTTKQENSAPCLQMATVDASPDMETGYPVLMVSICDSSMQLINGVAEYNQQMQDYWYRQLQKKNNER